MKRNFLLIFVVFILLGTLVCAASVENEPFEDALLQGGCEEILEEDSEEEIFAKDMCYATFSFLGAINLCSNVINEETKVECFRAFSTALAGSSEALSKKDPSLCDSLDYELSLFCYAAIARVKQDPGVCGLSPLPSARIICLSSLSKYPSTQQGFKMNKNIYYAIGGVILFAALGFITYKIIKRKTETGKYKDEDHTTIKKTKDRCSKCKALLIKEDKFCPECGKRV